MHSNLKKNTSLIGVGKWGQNLARNLEDLGVLRSICDTNEFRLDQYPNIHTTGNFKTVLEDQNVTRVVIATSPSRHYELCKRALLAKKDVLVEKPLCFDHRQAEELAELAASSNRILMVGHLLHYHPCVKKIQELIRSGKLGELKYISSTRFSLGKNHREETALWDLAPHDISLILSLCADKTPDQVRCIDGDENGAVMTMRFSNDLTAHVHVSFFHPYKEQKVVIVGSLATLVFDDMLPWGEKLLFYSRATDEPEKIDVWYEEPLYAECKHFLECCQYRTQPLTDGEEALRVQYILQAVQESLDSDGIVKTPLEKQLFPRKAPASRTEDVMLKETLNNSFTRSSVKNSKIN